MELSFVEAPKTARRGVLLVWLALFASPCLAQLTVGHIDDFQDGTAQNWGFFADGSLPVDNAADVGPDGAGDHALFMDTALHGGGRMLVINTVQWTGDWTAAGITQVAMDARNPNTFDLNLRLGIVGPGGVSVGGSGDTHITDSMVVPADNQWHPLVFPVLAADFTDLNGHDTAMALGDVTHVRIVNTANESFIGDFGGAVYFDNIRALGAPAMFSGDYNSDGAVDAADYVVWRKTLGQPVTPGTGADGTGPGGTPDGVVNSLDYDFWRAHFGNPSGDGHSHALATGLVSVPEPGTPLFLAWIAALAVGYHRRRRRGDC